jgi:hypothetical protein
MQYIWPIFVCPIKIEFYGAHSKCVCLIFVPFDICSFKLNPFELIYLTISVFCLSHSALFHYECLSSYLMFVSFDICHILHLFFSNCVYLKFYIWYSTFNIRYSTFSYSTSNIRYFKPFDIQLFNTQFVFNIRY